MLQTLEIDGHAIHKYTQSDISIRHTDMCIYKAMSKLSVENSVFSWRSDQDFFPVVGTDMQEGISLDRERR